MNKENAILSAKMAKSVGGNRNPRVFGTFCSKKYNKGSLKNEGYGELKCDVNHAF